MMIPRHGFLSPQQPKNRLCSSLFFQHSYDDNLYSLLHGYSELKIVHGQLKQMSIGRPAIPCSPRWKGHTVLIPRGACIIVVAIHRSLILHHGVLVQTMIVVFIVLCKCCFNFYVCIILISKSSHQNK